MKLGHDAYVFITRFSALLCVFEIFHNKKHFVCLFDVVKAESLSASGDVSLLGTVAVILLPD